MYEIPLLKALLNVENYTEYRNYIELEDVTPDLVPILRAVDSWFTENVDPPTIEDIALLTFAGNIPEKNKDIVKQALEAMKSNDGSESVHKLLESFRRNRWLSTLALTAIDAQTGRKSLTEVLSLADKLRAPQKQLVTYVTEDLNEILHHTVEQRGLRWRLDSLNKRLGSLRKGNFGFVFARPETGKTTFLSSEVTHMATQISTPGSGPVLWFNNEQPGADVQLRIYEAALGKTRKELRAEREKYGNEYKTLFGGKILLVDDVTASRGKIEAVCAREKPSLIIFDQIDKITGFKADRRDLEMGEIYKWAREMAKTYCPVIGVCQADGSADGEAWLNMGHVADAKTAKQAEADFILGIGKSHDGGKEFIRYISICKNKLSGDDDTEPSLRHEKVTVLLQPEIGRYCDL